MEEIKTYILTHKETGEPFVMTEKVYKKVMREAGLEKIQASFDIEVVFTPKLVSPPQTPP